MPPTYPHMGFADDLAILGNFVFLAQKMVPLKGH